MIHARDSRHYQSTPVQSLAYNPFHRTFRVRFTGEATLQKEKKEKICFSDADFFVYNEAERVINLQALKLQ